MRIVNKIQYAAFENAPAPLGGARLPVAEVAKIAGDFIGRRRDEVDN